MKNEKNKDDISVKTVDSMEEAGARAAAEAAAEMEAEETAVNEWETVAETETEAAAEVADEADKQVKELTAKLAEAEKLRLLALAEMDNQRKRLANEREALRLNTEQNTVMPFLQVFDHFTMAVTAAGSSTNLDALLKGMEMIQKEFDRAFSELGIEKIEAVGKDFDPNLHEAMAQEPSETVPAGKVIKQWCLGFKAGSRLLKPAMVIVSSGKPEEEKA